jgi:hypothetical protein
MSEHDKRNLRFLLSLGKLGIIRFLAQASADDMLYAAELLKRHREIMIEKQYEREIEEYMTQDDSNIENFNDAKDYLKKFTLKG